MKDIRQTVNRHILEILLIFSALFFFTTKHLDEPYDQVIMAEGLGYYAYLPAVFIYDDLSFNFFNDIHSKYYATTYNPPTRNFVLEFDGIRLNKYFPGVSLLWLPFFLIAHLLAKLLHLAADGYSPVYQYAIGIAGLFYTWLGLYFTRCILRHHRISATVQSVVLAGILFATNLLLYSASWSAQTHCYSFFLIAAFCWCVIRLFDEETGRKGAYLAFVFMLMACIVTIRPQNGIIVLLLPFLGFRWNAVVTLVRRHLFTPIALAGLFVAVLLVARVSYYWYVQTGKIFLQPYHGEAYYFNKPHVMDVLFSFRKGWILYTPFVAFGLAGIFFAKDRKNRMNLLLFWSLLVYITSCWWCWTYSPSSFGQRPFVDFYSILALQVGFFFQFLEKKNLAWIFVVVLLLLVPFNLLQTHQYRKGIIPGEFGSSETYFDNLLAIKPVAYYPVPRQTILDKTEVLQSFDDAPSMNRTDGESVSGLQSAFVSASHVYSENILAAIPPFLVPGLYSHVRVSAMIKSSPALAKHENVVLDFKRNGTTVSYQGFGLGWFVFDREWKKVQFGLELPQDVKTGDSLLVYLWRAESPNGDTTWIDDLRIEFIHTDDSFDFRVAK